MKIIITVCVIFSVFILIAAGSIEKNPQWKGKIEYEDGVKVIENPKKPLYGEIMFELEEDFCIGNKEDENYSFSRVRGIAVDDQGNIYASDADKQRIQKYDRDGRFLQTIGRTAQRDGALRLPMKVLLDEKTGFLYVLDRRYIKIFNKEGIYLANIPFRFRPSNFLLAEDGNIFANSYIGPSILFRKINSKGQILIEITKLPYKPVFVIVHESMLPGDGYVGVEYNLFITQIDSHSLIYGYSKEYELNVINCEGKPIYKIRKKEPHRKFSRRLRKEGGKRLPPHKPFFHSLFTDSDGRIYVQTNINRLIEDKKCDVFSKDGYYLYKTVLPRASKTIKRGYLFTFETGTVNGEPVRQIKRYKITNWNQIQK